MKTHSAFAQGVDLQRVPADTLMDSPRNYNPSIIEHGGEVWMAYRSHRMADNGRCGIAMARLDERNEAADNTWIALPGRSGGEHHEDPRLFMFNGEVHLCYVESLFYRDRAYTCQICYTRLERTEAGWKAGRVFRPRYGKNDGRNQEKNWSFFDDGGRLRCIYQSGNPHTVLTIDGEEVVAVETDETPVVWPWGTMRGGGPPVKLENGEWLTVFHSSLPGPTAPHWRRYYAGAYTFEGAAPWRITSISHRPLLAGSEADGHAHDPRWNHSWKPFVVFPGGMIPTADVEGGAWRVAYGINDHSIAIATHGEAEMALGDPLFATWEPRYFLADNATLPVRVYGVNDGQTGAWLQWGRVRRGAPYPGNPGVMRIANPAHVEVVADRLGVTEISREDFEELAEGV